MTWLVIEIRIINHRNEFIFLAERVGLFSKHLNKTIILKKKTLDNINIIMNDYWCLTEMFHLKTIDHRCKHLDSFECCVSQIGSAHLILPISDVQLQQQSTGDFSIETNKPVSLSVQLI